MFCNITISQTSQLFNLFNEIIEGGIHRRLQIGSIKHISITVSIISTVKWNYLNDCVIELRAGRGTRIGIVRSHFKFAWPAHMAYT